MLTNTKREGIDTFVCDVSLYVAGTPKASINQRKTLSTHNTNRHCRVRFYAFVRQPLSKQLYTGWGTHPGACFWSVFQDQAPSCVPAF